MTAQERKDNARLLRTHGRLPYFVDSNVGRGSAARRSRHEQSRERWDEQARSRTCRSRHFLDDFIVVSVSLLNDIDKPFAAYRIEPPPRGVQEEVVDIA